MQNLFEVLVRSENLRLGIKSNNKEKQCRFLYQKLSDKSRINTSKERKPNNESKTDSFSKTMNSKTAVH